MLHLRGGYGTPPLHRQVIKLKLLLMSTAGLFSNAGKQMFYKNRVTVNSPVKAASPNVSANVTPNKRGIIPLRSMWDLLSMTCRCHLLSQ